MIAIVFDKSGTLVDTKRVSKDLEKNEFIYYKSCIELIEDNPNLFLVTIATDPRCTFLQEDSKKSLGNSIKDLNIGFEVVFKGINAGNAFRFLYSQDFHKKPEHQLFDFCWLIL